MLADAEAVTETVTRGRIETPARAATGREMTVTAAPGDTKRAVTGAAAAAL